MEEPSLHEQDARWRRIHVRRVVYGNMGMVLWMSAVTTHFLNVAQPYLKRAFLTGQVRSLLELLTVLLFLGGAFCHVYAKGRHGAWTLVGLLGCFALPMLSFLKPKCLHCGQLGAERWPVCPRCNAPL